MKRADWLNLIQAGLATLQSINLGLIMLHANPYITMTAGSVLVGGTVFVHLLGINTPAPGQIMQALPDESKTGGTK